MGIPFSGDSGHLGTESPLQEIWWGFRPVGIPSSGDSVQWGFRPVGIPGTYLFIHLLKVKYEVVSLLMNVAAVFKPLKHLKLVIFKSNL